MRHASALLVVGLLTTAGCIGGPVAGTPTASPTLDQAPHPNTTASIGDGPRERPARPATLNESTVEDYVHAFEYRYAYNSLWMSEHTEVSLACDVESTTTEQNGYDVTVTCTGSSTTGGEVEGNRAATTVHADWGTREVRYHADGNSTVRFGFVGTG